MDQWNPCLPFLMNGIHYLGLSLEPFRERDEPMSEEECEGRKEILGAVKAWESLERRVNVSQRCPCLTSELREVISGH